MAIFSWKGLQEERLRKLKPKIKIEHPRLEKGELFAVQLPIGSQFLRDLERNKIRGILFLGTTGSGKSSSLEDLAEFFIQKGETVIDFHAAYWENVFWARKYKVVLVQAPSKYELKSKNEQLEIHTWHEDFDWEAILKKAQDKKSVLAASCWLPDENYYLMLQEFTDALLDPLLAFPRVVVIRDLVSLLPSGMKESSSKELVELKRKMLLFTRQGRKVGNRIFADTQVAEDILRSFRENIWVRVYKYIEVQLPKIPEDVAEQITYLNEKQAVIHYKGQYFGATFALNECHKKETDKLSDLGLEITEISESPEVMSKSVEGPRASFSAKELKAYYIVLRQIAREEYLKARVPASTVDQVVQVDFPSDPAAKVWTYQDVVRTLGLSIRSDSVGKNYREHRRKATNNVKEKIGLRFVKYLAAREAAAGALPTQIFFSSGAGARDVSFKLGNKLVASANVKLFLDDHPSRMIHLAPEFQDPVHYGIIITAKPFRVICFRGPGSEYVARGSVSDLGWRGFIKDLRKEAKGKEGTNI